MSTGQTTIFVTIPRNSSPCRHKELPDIEDLACCARFDESDFRSMYEEFGAFTLVATHHNGLVLELELTY